MLLLKLSMRNIYIYTVQHQEKLEIQKVKKKKLGLTKADVTLDPAKIPHPKNAGLFELAVEGETEIGLEYARA